MGAGNAAQIHATAGREDAKRLHNSVLLTRMLRHNTNLAILRGEWKMAQEFNVRTFAESPGDLLAIADGAVLNLQMGYLEESREYSN